MSVDLGVNVKIKCLLYAITFLTYIPNVHAQNNISFNHLTVDNGLSQSSVTCIFQDKKDLTVMV